VVPLSDDINVIKYCPNFIPEKKLLLLLGFIFILETDLCILIS